MVYTFECRYINTFPIPYDRLPSFAGCDLHNAHDLRERSGTCVRGWICAVQILHNLFATAGEELNDLSVDDLCFRGVTCSVWGVVDLGMNTTTKAYLWD